MKTGFGGKDAAFRNRWLLSYLDRIFVRVVGHGSGEDRQVHAVGAGAVAVLGFVIFLKDGVQPVVCEDETSMNQAVEIFC